MKYTPKAIIFDWDNTILDTFPLITDAIDETMVKMGKEPWGYEKVKKNVHKSMREYFPEIFGEKWEEAGKIYKDSYHKNHLKDLVLIKDSLKLIDFAIQKDIQRCRLGRIQQIHWCQTRKNHKALRAKTRLHPL